MSQLLRRALDAALKDKELLADADKQQLEINPVSGAEMEAIIKRVFATPRSIVMKLAEASKAQPDLKVLQAPAKEEKGGKKE